MRSYPQGVAPKTSGPGDTFASNVTERQPQPSRAVIVAGFAGVMGLGTLIFFFHLGTYGLWEPDEARYAEIAREMLVLHSFLLPHLNYVPYIEKPPLLYWLTAFFMRVFGVNEFGARFVDALAALVGLAATWFFTLRVFDWRRAMIAGGMLATTVLYAEMAQVLTTDMLLTALMTIAMYAFFLHWREGGRWCWLFYLAIALATLTKGPIGAAIPVVVAIIFLWWQGELSGSVRRFHAIAGFSLAIVISAPWFIYMIFSVRDFFNFYFVGEYLRRFFQRNYSHYEPFYYYIPVFLGGLLPWTLLVPFLRWRGRQPNPARRFCVIVAGFVFVLFSIANAKLIPYVLPAFPFCVILIADGLAELFEGDNATTGANARRLAILGPILSIAGVALVVVAMEAHRFHSPYPTLVKPALVAAGAILLVGGIGCFAAFWSRGLRLGIAIFTAVAILLLLVGSYGRIMAEPMRSQAVLARAIEKLEPKATLICFPSYVQSLPFYCRRRVILVGDKTELAFGAAHDPDASKYFFTSRKALLRLWNESKPTVLVVNRRALTAPVRRLLGPYKVIASDREKFAIMPIHQTRKPK